MSEKLSIFYLFFYLIIAVNFTIQYFCYKRADSIMAGENWLLKIFPKPKKVVERILLSPSLSIDVHCIQE